MDNFLSSTTNGDSNLTVALEEASTFSSICYRNSETQTCWFVNNVLVLLCMRLFMRLYGIRKDKQKALRRDCIYYMSHDMRFPTMWYVWPAKPLKLLTEHHLEFLSLKGGCTGQPESTLVKMPHCWKSHVTAHIEHKDLEIRVSGFYLHKL